MAGAGRRVFQPGEVLTASNVMSYLQDQAVMTFAGTAARGSAIGTAVAEGMVSYLNDLNQIQVYDGSAWQQVYPFVPNIGSILQVVSTTKTDTFSTASTTFIDVTGMSVTITPSSTTSRVLVLVNMSLSAASTVNNYARLLRGSTVIAAGATAGTRVSGFGQVRPPDAYSVFSASTNYLDSPATTSATTYKVQITNNTAANIYVNRNDNDLDGLNSLRSSSTITVLEIA